MMSPGLRPPRRHGLGSNLADVDAFRPGWNLFCLVRMLGEILFCIRCQDSEGWTLRAGVLFRELGEFPLVEPENHVTVGNGDGHAPGH